MESLKKKIRNELLDPSIDYVYQTVKPWLWVSGGIMLILVILIMWNTVLLMWVKKLIIEKARIAS